VIAVPHPIVTEVHSRTSSQAAALPHVHVLRLPWRPLMLGVVLLLAAFLDFFQLSREGWSNDYYAAAVRSMLQNWHNFFFVSLDPGGFVTIDKPPLGFWIETASAKLFGYNGVSLIAPQALAAVLAVAVLYRMVSRAFGFPAGLVAALALAITPVSVVGARSNNIDSQLVLVVLLTAWAALKATETGRLRWLLLTAVLLGLGFNIKTMQAYLILPACGLVYLLAAANHWRTRLAHLALALVVLLGISFAWITAVDHTPASARPYVGSSCTNSELNLALGYNGLGRLTGGLFATCTASETAGQTTTSSSSAQANGQSAAAPDGDPGGGGPGGVGQNGPTGPFRLLDAQLGGQVGWLLPLAVIGLVVAALESNWRRLVERKRFRLALDRRQQSLVLWGMWLLAQAAFFSVAGFFHSYYLVMLAPAIAALSGIGVAALWQGYRRGGWRSWLLPVALLAVAAVQVYLLNPYPDWSVWLTPLIVGLALIGAVTLLVTRLFLGRMVWAALGAVILGLAALFSAPTTWAAYTMQHGTGRGLGQAGPSARGAFGGPGGFGGSPQLRISGTHLSQSSGASVPSSGSGGNTGGPSAFGGSGGAGPGGPGGNNGGPGTLGGPGGAGPSERDTGIGRGAGGPGVFGGPGGNPGGQVNQQLLKYLEQHQGTTKYLVAVPSSVEADGYIIATGKPVMALGGFNGSDKILTVAQLKQLVKNGTVRYFLLSGGDNGPAAASPEFPAQLPEAVRAQVEARLKTGGRAGGGPGGNVNADLTNWVSTSCALVPASAYGSSSTTSTASGGFGGFGGSAQLYDCGAKPATSR
jgi:4-amino-4-deoxy-L-arabinose transferase-like glycosyltransferase